MAVIVAVVADADWLVAVSVVAVVVDRIRTRQDSLGLVVVVLRKDNLADLPDSH